ncbi:MAG: glutamine-hydrolyzing GMP synthase [Candidatus Tectomicrobia bacterium]|nr:glutamine-hydrolyzing GMP synthase [Candidatus Tectomicrobia bacterium]
MQHPETIVILDFGSQYTQLIARRVRECQVYSEIVPYHAAAASLRRPEVRGLILSGSPASVTLSPAPLPDPQILQLGLPLLGICYGMQVLTRLLGGRVGAAAAREYGRAELCLEAAGRREPLLAGIADEGGPIVVWMSHGDRIEAAPEGFTRLAHTANSPVAAMGNGARRCYGLQFHPEVAHTPCGRAILANFVQRICGCRGDWTVASFIEQATAAVRAQAPRGGIICGLSGGVDSAVAAALVQRAAGDRLACVFVDTGLLRLGEEEAVRDTFEAHFGMRLSCVDARRRFLEALDGVEDPEEKRRRIGHEFIAVFEEEAVRLGARGALGAEGVRYLAQGTLYPDVIESVSAVGPSATIKSHHNVGGLPARMELDLIEPLRFLFKDEVRQVGLALGLPEQLVWRHPFPGPGLAIRILGAVTAERLAILQQADAIVRQVIEAEPTWQRQLWQAFPVLLPVRTVGVMGDERTYEHVVAVRAVTSLDGMTADWARLPHDLLDRLASRIISEVRGVNRVTYDISSKPPATIEWE